MSARRLVGLPAQLPNLLGAGPSIWMGGFYLPADRLDSGVFGIAEGALIVCQSHRRRDRSP
jgi:hypothetical protein